MINANKAWRLHDAAPAPCIEPGCNRPATSGMRLCKAHFDAFLFLEIYPMAEYFVALATSKRKYLGLNNLAFPFLD